MPTAACNACTSIFHADSECAYTQRKEEGGGGERKRERGEEGRGKRERGGEREGRGERGEEV